VRSRVVGIGGAELRPVVFTAVVVASVAVAAVLGFSRGAGIAAAERAVTIRHRPPLRGCPHSVGHLDPTLTPWEIESIPSRCLERKGEMANCVRLCAVSGRGNPDLGYCPALSCDDFAEQKVGGLSNWRHVASPGPVPGGDTL
jgi:hypothetical protein